MPERVSPLLVDLYELTMAESYLAEGLADRPATFELMCRRLPPGWGYLLVAGIETALDVLRGLRFSGDELAFLESTGLFGGALLERLRDLRFTGAVRAMPEGTPAFPDEPLVSVTAPLMEAQLVETAVLNAVHFETLIASKAARCVDAARGRRLVEFGLRRTHGLEAGLRVARSAWVAGFDATSNVLAGKRFGIPIAGTMAHSYVECFRDEREAFEAFVRRYPSGSTLLVDTYDTLEGVRRAASVATALAARGGHVKAVRLDSGDLGELSRASRALLDEAGHPEVEIFASGNLDEVEVERLLEAGAPIDGFGIGTKLGVSADAPSLEMAYKLVAFDGKPTVKLSPGKRSLPQPKQVWRVCEDGTAVHDEIGLASEDGPVTGEPLLQPRLGPGAVSGGLAAARARAARARASLPAGLRRLEAASYPVELSPGLQQAAVAAMAAARARAVRRR